ncbi:MAG: aminotransferase class V-fold PLP-dependent enzyme [SAR324 cluster bacterium]|nr:aminotransferase class V-fold PLP-dependent enzyme [SAR324 cluster bacterium]MBL7035003.1 aminotransferase class V-fold PLP-dependent enzyme [SAR324 cluster bacterium]
MSEQNPVFIPGPTNIPEEIRKACDIGTMDHRSAKFSEIINPALAGLKKILKTETAEVVVFPSSGTGAWEAAISNTLSAGDKVLAAEQGMFSQKWIEMCRRHNLEMQVFEVEWGESCPVSAYAEALKADTGHQIKAVLVTHNETATGVLSDVSAVRKALDAANHPALLLVDGVSSIASIDFKLDEWGVDIAVAGSQKGFMLPAGLSIVGISQKAISAMETATLPRFYFDLREMMKHLSSGGYPYTPIVGMLNGLKKSTEMLLAEGLENVFARHHRLAEGVRKAVKAWGLEMCALREEIFSDTVTAILVPDGFDGTELVNHAANKYGVSFGGGLGRVAGKVFRIGHLGSLTDVMALSGIAAAEMAMVDLGFPIKLGSGVSAAQEYYRNSAK